MSIINYCTVCHIPVDSLELCDPVGVSSVLLPLLSVSCLLLLTVEPGETEDFSDTLPDDLSDTLPDVLPLC